MGDRVSAATSATSRVGLGAAVVLVVTVLAYAAARLPGAATLGPLVLALLGGVAVAATPWGRRHRLAERRDVRFVARDVLRIGIVLLGARLDTRLLVEVGPIALAAGAVGALVAFAAAETIGRTWGLPAPLRRAVGIGTAICGASAIAAALPLLRARAEHASLAVATISLVGTVGVVAVALLGGAYPDAALLLALLAGATLQEVGHVVAAGANLAPAVADQALLVKLSRVVLLAPALLVLGLTTRRGDAPEGPRVAPVPPFVLGFVAMSVLVSVGVLPTPWAHAIATGGSVATAAAMAALGLGVDLRTVRASGRATLALGALTFGLLVAVMGAAYALPLR